LDAFGGGVQSNPRERRAVCFGVLNSPIGDGARGNLRIRGSRRSIRGNFACRHFLPLHNTLGECHSGDNSFYNKHGKFIVFYATL